jgi:hypothetical protein
MRGIYIFTFIKEIDFVVIIRKFTNKYYKMINVKYTILINYMILTINLNDESEKLYNNYFKLILYCIEMILNIS